MNWYQHIVQRIPFSWYKLVSAKIIKAHYYDSRRQMLIAQAMETPEGRAALAQAMVTPIRRALDYQSVGRRLFMVDALPLT